MTIQTKSAFNYGHIITENNQFINFSEDGIEELIAIIDVGSYSLGDFVNKVAEALNAAGDLDYDVTLDRTTRRITIASTANFYLLIDSGTQKSISAFGLIGFTGADLSGLNSYEGDIASGFQFRPQLKLQSYVPFENDQRAASSKLNKSALGSVELFSYGIEKFMSCNITLQTDIEQGRNSILETDLNGVANLRSFLVYCTTKSPLEFVPDRDAPTIFDKVLLESTPGNQDGSGFSLKELYSRKLAFYFESGIIKFRLLD